MGEVLPGVRPDRLDVVDIRFPPQNTVWDDMYNEVNYAPETLSQAVSVSSQAKACHALLALGGDQSI